MNMVSAEQYVIAFQKVMPRRIEELRELVNSKKAIDDIFLRTKVLSRDNANRLLEIIGKNSLFKKGTKRKGTLRHRIFKINKSLNVARHYMKRSEKELLKDKDIEGRIISRGALFEINKLVESIIDVTDQLEEVYRIQEYTLHGVVSDPVKYTRDYEAIIYTERELIEKVRPFVPLVTSITKSINIQLRNILSWKPQKSDTWPLFIYVMALIVITQVEGFIYGFFKTNNFLANNLLQVIFKVPSLAMVWSFPAAVESIKASIQESLED